VNRQPCFDRLAGLSVSWLFDRTAMIRNGLYLYESKALDAGEGGYSGVVVLRDGSFLGGSSFFYLVGSYSCSGERWKGELTQQEHTPAPLTFATARRIVTAGFTGTYTDEGAEFEATALVGKRSLRYHAIMRLLTAV
jgi:hypothetical protein